MGASVKKRKHNAKADSNDIQAAVEDFGQKYHCDACSKDITHLIIIRCAICADFDLCVNCFCSGVELHDHKRNHDYRVIDILDFPIFEADWGADEELLLVEGLELFGLGNWESISEHIGTKNALQVGRHYQKIYVNSDKWPYPDMTDKFEMKPGKRQKARSPNYTVVKLPKHARPPASQPVNHDIGGFMPGRKEFEHEYENDADQIVKDIEFTPEDTKEDTALKCAILDNYNIILDRRLARKAFIFERGFTDFKKIQGIEKKRPREEKEMYQKYRVFAKMQTTDDFDQFMDGVLAEMRLRNTISQLQEYIRMGISTMKEANDYEKHKVSRANKVVTLQADRPIPKRSINTMREDTPPGSPRSASISLPHAGAPLTRNTIVPLDLSGAEGVELLTEDEKTLCSSLRVYPRAYLAIKDFSLKEFAAKGVFNRRAVRTVIKIDPSKTMRIFDFFQQMGWIVGDN